MKILYLTQDHDSGEQAARSLHAIAQNVTLTSVQTPGSALRWLHQNPDAAAVIVAASPENCALFVDHALPRLVDHASARDRRQRHEFARTLSEVEAASSARIGELEAKHTAALRREARLSTALQQQVFELEHALRNAEERRASEAGAFADQLAKRHAEFTASLTRTLQSRDALASELTGATAALEEAHKARMADAAAAAEHLHRREAELGAALAEASAARATLERALADAEAAARDASTQAAIDLAAAQERHAALDELLTQEVERRTSLEQRFADAESEFDAAEERHATDQARSAARLAEAQARYDAAVVEHAAERAALERQFAEAAADARRQSDRRAHRLLHVVAAYRRRGREQKAALDAQLTAVRTECARERDEKNALNETLHAAQEQARSLQRTLDDERQAHEHATQTSASELERVTAEHTQLRQSFDRLQTAFQMLDEIAGEHASERARLENVVAARDSELHAQAQRHRIAEQSAQDAFAHAEDSYRQAVAARDSDIARLQREADGLRRQLHNTKARVDVLQREAERLPGLESQLESTRKERRRDFERAPYGLCRCTPAGVIVDANHSFVGMIGRRRADDVRNMEFTAAVFDCAGDLGWLLERTRTTRSTDSVETTWKTRDGRELFVRLQASATPEFVDIVVEDLTKYRTLEERLRQAQRIEAVGRVASEVAVTCEALLGDVAGGVQEWMAADADPRARRHGERLLADVTRAASHLRQLGVYGDQQLRALAPVSVQRVLRDLAPVLKRVVGDRIGVVLAKSSGSFDVDVEAERLERVLVNVAGYARERMPDGGQMRIDLATTALGRRFVTRYPNVRPGHHVLITVTEVAGGESRDATASDSRSPNRPGVDLGALVALVGSCGGHLWLEAQPAGNLVVKIYLPRRAAVDAAGGDLPPGRDGRGGRLARWFRSTPAMRIRA